MTFHSNSQPFSERYRQTGYCLLSSVACWRHMKERDRC